MALGGPQASDFVDATDVDLLFAAGPRHRPTGLGPSGPRRRDDRQENTALLGPKLISRWARYAPPTLTEWVFRRDATSESPNKLIDVPVLQRAGSAPTGTYRRRGSRTVPVGRPAHILGGREHHRLELRRPTQHRRARRRRDVRRSARVDRCDGRGFRAHSPGCRSCRQRPRIRSPLAPTVSSAYRSFADACHHRSDGIRLRRWPSRGLSRPSGRDWQAAAP